MIAPHAMETGNATSNPSHGPMPKWMNSAAVDVGAEPDIERVAERELAGEAHHDVPGLPEIGEVEDEDQDGQQVVVDEERAPIRSASSSAASSSKARRGRAPVSRADHDALPAQDALRAQQQHQHQDREREHALRGRREEQPGERLGDADQHAAEQRARHRAEPAGDDDDEGEQRIDRPDLRRDVDDQHQHAPAAPTQAAPSPKVSA